MRSVIRTLAFFMICLVCAAPGCDDRADFETRQAQEQLRSSVDSLASAISSATPDAAMLEAFESSAIIKLSDLADYINLLADTATAPEFRDQVNQLIRGMFITPDTEIPYKKPFTISPDSSWVIKPLERVNDSLYTGTLGFTCRINFPDGGDQFSGKITTGEVMICLARKEKAFGESRRRIWSLFLGKIEFE